MELFACHNSREKSYRDPLGAVACGTEIVLRLRLWGQDAERAWTKLRLWTEGHEQLIDGCPEWHDGRLYHSYRFTAPHEPQLLWYYFIIDANYERRFYGGRSGEGRPSGTQPQDYQITVYDPAFTTPEWFREAIVYQIFPDRFRRGRPDEQGQTALDRLDCHEKLGRRVLRHENWDEPVLHTPLPGEKYYAPCDYFGGDLEGIIEKLPYIASLGVSCIYLNPIFEAASNHRYNTADYTKVDPVLGTEKELERLVREAGALGIRVVADGVFSHTGDDSVYFNRYGRYPSVGAYSGPQSPYYEWYDFRHFPDKYRCWWGFETLPEVKEETPSYVAFIRSVLAQWAERGLTSWRLDVADELPDCFIEELRRAVKARDGEALLLGEVWDDASNKMWEKGLRKYVLGHELDSVMNYPFRDAVLDFMTGMIDAYALNDALGGQRERYPEPFYRACMNTLGSHDTERVLSVLSGAPKKDTLSRAQQAAFRTGEEDLALGKKRLMAASCLQYTMPQPPALFYGDEAGLTGLSDPFNRGTFPWGHEDRLLLEHYRRLGRIRRRSNALVFGETAFLPVNQDVFAIYRRFGNETALTVVNRSREQRSAEFTESDFTEGPDAGRVRFAPEYRCMLRGERFCTSGEKGLSIEMQPISCIMLAGKLEDERDPDGPSTANK